MTRDDILRWALEAGFPRIGDKPIISCGRDELERFAAIVAAHERTACAEICDEEARGINPKYGKIMAMMIGERIRARGDE